MTREQLRSEVNKIRWFHSIDLGGGLITPGWEGNSTRQKLGLLSLPEDLRGLTVLDIGAWTNSFPLRQSAAALRVSSPPIPIGGVETAGEPRMAFKLAGKILQSRVEDKDIEVLDISPEAVGLFDLVLFLGVLYHLKHPLLGLEV